MNFGSLIPWREKTPVPSQRDDFFDPMVTFRREVDRVFDDFARGFGGLRPFANGWRSTMPVIDVAESDNDVTITAELPGLDEKDFEVTLSGDLLTIKGEKKSAHDEKGGNGESYYAERHYGAFSRAVRLPFDTKDEQVDAKYDKGILTVRVPKPADLQKPVRRIEVKAA